MLNIIYVYVLSGIYSKNKNYCKEILKLHQVILLLIVILVLGLIRTQDFHCQRKNINVRQNIPVILKLQILIRIYLKVFKIISQFGPWKEPNANYAPAGKNKISRYIYDLTHKTFTQSKAKLKSWLNPTLPFRCSYLCNWT